MGGRYAMEFAAMEELGCSWPELMETPWDVVEEALWRRKCRLNWERQKREAEGRR